MDSLNEIQDEHEKVYRFNKRVQQLEDLKIFEQMLKMRLDIRCEVGIPISMMDVRPQRPIKIMKGETQHRLRGWVQEEIARLEKEMEKD